MKTIFWCEVGKKNEENKRKSRVRQAKLAYTSWTIQPG
jgi:hypothetical protein